MDAKDRVINELVNALDGILREASKPDGSIHFIAGAAGQAMKTVRSQQVLNSDGYPVIPAMLIAHGSQR